MDGGSIYMSSAKTAWLGRIDWWVSGAYVSATLYTYKDKTIDSGNSAPTTGEQFTATLTIGSSSETFYYGQQNADEMEIGSLENVYVSGSTVTISAKVVAPSGVSMAGESNALSGSETVTLTSEIYTISISAGTGTTLSVVREWSSEGLTGTLSDGSVIYASDSLEITATAKTGYELNNYIYNDLENKFDDDFYVPFQLTNIVKNSSNERYRVLADGNAAVATSASVKSCTLSISEGIGSVITVDRIESPLQDASLGILSNRDTVYYGDVLEISFLSSTEYEILTQTVNGSAFMSGNSITIDDTYISAGLSVATTTRIFGITYIYNGTSFDKYLICIYNGKSWDTYIPYIYNGSDWCICS